MAVNVRVVLDVERGPQPVALVVEDDVADRQLAGRDGLDDLGGLPDGGLREATDLAALAEPLDLALDLRVLLEGVVAQAGPVAGASVSIAPMRRTPHRLCSSPAMATWTTWRR
ncbi:hypothetical protein SAMN05660642_04642 [Geodermatophilus siccatus]|uniref:Uncharacterized protein n=1 Tax=Geodermatophilus siccatus TaxID=1137991 RepID=A0A1H0AQ89_9ACTN|nr:hypothetical protein [Geodermatophilus siccatus]SDN35263.1 hypothetical protein SAMN05660642_04642 [Geodermatophilus siccatus]